MTRRRRPISYVTTCASASQSSSSPGGTSSCRAIWLAIDAGRGEQRRLVPEQRGDLGLQRVDRRVLAVDVVADLGGGHRLPHPGGVGRVTVSLRRSHDAARCRREPASPADQPRSISATRKASSSDCWVFSRGSQAVS